MRCLVHQLWRTHKAGNTLSFASLCDDCPHQGRHPRCQITDPNTYVALLGPDFRHESTKQAPSSRFAMFFLSVMRNRLMLRKLPWRTTLRMFVCSPVFNHHQTLSVRFELRTVSLRLSVCGRSLGAIVLSIPRCLRFRTPASTSRLLHTIALAALRHSTRPTQGFALCGTSMTFGLHVTEWKCTVRNNKEP